MPSFKNDYRKLFQTFGYPLNARTAIPAATIAAAEKRLGVRVPAALRDYYLVAGRESRFNRSHNRLLSPDQWRLDQRRLIFQEENQGVVWWGVSVRSAAKDPAVFQSVNEEPLQWMPDARRCSKFLLASLHFQAVSGGMPHCGWAQAPETSDYRFERRGWTSYGVIGGVSAYSRPNQVVCLMPPSGFLDRWTIAAGLKTKGDLQALALELAVKF